MLRIKTILKALGGLPENEIRRAVEYLVEKEYVAEIGLRSESLLVRLISTVDARPDAGYKLTAKGI
jgi:hypothetical protein